MRRSEITTEFDIYTGDCREPVCDYRVMWERWWRLLMWTIVNPSPVLRDWRRLLSTSVVNVLYIVNYE